VTQKTLDRLTVVAALIMLVAALYVLYQVLEGTRLSDVLDQLQGMPGWQLVGAAALTVASYAFLTIYDLLALDYAGCRLRFRQVVLASFVAFAFTNGLGFALVSGGSVRLRIYSGFGLTPVQVGEVVAYCTLTYGLGVAAVGGLTFVLDSTQIAAAMSLQPQLPRVIGVVLLAGVAAYLIAVARRSRPIVLGRYHLRLPTVRQSLLQVGLASVDQAVAASVLYVLLPSGGGIDFLLYLGMYIIAAPLSMLGMVPGGLGVFDTALVVMMGSVPKAATLASLVVYRCVYFLLPLAVAIVCDAIYEFRRASRGLKLPR